MAVAAIDAAFNSLTIQVLVEFAIQNPLDRLWEIIVESASLPAGRGSGGQSDITIRLVANKGGRYPPYFLNRTWRYGWFVCAIRLCFRVHDPHRRRSADQPEPMGDTNKPCARSLGAGDPRNGRPLNARTAHAE
jgi:hypothetical protein